jgi:DNA-binding NtrC family response regulator
VDDDQDTRDLLKRILVYAGATVRVATTAREASLALEEADVVVTDYRLPDDTALLLLERAHQRARPARVILLTSHVDLHVKAIRPRAAQAHRPLAQPIQVTGNVMALGNGALGVPDGLAEVEPRSSELAADRKGDPDVAAAVVHQRGHHGAAWYSPLVRSGSQGRRNAERNVSSQCRWA